MTGQLLHLPHIQPPPARTWAEAAERWHQDSTAKKPATLIDQAGILEWLRPRWAEHRLGDIDADTIRNTLNEAHRAGLGPRRVNRYAEVIRAVLRAAARWRWLDHVPDIKLTPRPPRRVRFLTHDQAQALIHELPDHLAAIAGFSLETGLRKSNVLGLTWSQVDLSIPAAWIHADQAKARHAIPVPLSPTATAIIETQRGRHRHYVFTYRGNPIKQCNTKSWRAALRRTAIVDFRWHDLRHTWASWHAQHGTPLHVLQELGGWQTADMVRAYAHLSTKHLRQFVLDFHAATHGSARRTQR